MGKSAPEPAPAPDPYATARAQTSSNVSTSIANAVMGNANETSPLGSVRYQQNGSYQLKEPVLDKDGKPTTTKRWVSDNGTAAPSPADSAFMGTSGSGQQIDTRTGQAWDPYQANTGGHWVEEDAYSTRDLPIWERITSLSPEQQGIYDRQTKAQTSLLDFANSQIGKLQSSLGTPLNLDGLPEATTDFSADRSRVEQALYDRMAPQLTQSRDALENKLVNQGFSRGSEAFRSEMDQAARGENDARLAVIAAGGQEQDRLAALQATARERAIQERMMVRNAPLNEISSILGTSQVQMPQFTPFQSSPMAATPVGDYVYKSADINQKNAQIAAQQQNAAMSGIFGLAGTLGSAALGGPAGLMAKWSERSLKRNIRWVTTLPNGLNVFEFNYLWSSEPQRGVMADEVERIMPHAIERHETGLRAVNYDLVMA